MKLEDFGTIARTIARTYPKRAEMVAFLNSTGRGVVSFAAVIRVVTQRFNVGNVK